MILKGIASFICILFIQSPAFSINEGVEKYKSLYARPTQIPFPKDNQYSPDREKLGRMLFFDPRLSGSMFISCASCHIPGFSYTDAVPKAIGHGMKTLGRRTPTLLNAAWGYSFFWDGRAETLEEQALGPISAASEMNLSLEDLEKRLKSIPGYVELFARAYPREQLSVKTIAKAIATFERVGTVSFVAPFDKWIAGDESAISESAKRGFALFNEKAMCSKCHSGWRFTDDGFHDIGISTLDKGRGAVIPDVAVNQYAFKTPTLRNVELRAPYMHDGSEANLGSVIDLYNDGGRVKRPSISRLVKPLALSEQEKSDLINFLKTLNSPFKKIETDLFFQPGM